MDEPNLYTVTARLQKNNETFDEIYANLGVRSYTCLLYTSNATNDHRTRHCLFLLKTNAETFPYSYTDF